MRFLESDSMLTLLPAEPRIELQAADKFNGLLAGQGGDVTRLAKLTAANVLQTAQINLAGNPVAVIWFRIENYRLIVDTLVSVSKGRTAEQSFEAIWNGVAGIARAHGCTSVEGTTARRALADIYLAHGFTARGVVFRKNL